MKPSNGRPPSKPPWTNQANQVTTKLYARQLQHQETTITTMTALKEQKHRQPMEGRTNVQLKEHVKDQQDRVHTRASSTI
eukprot:5798198-Ditylum_brightwellii.AAC.1